MSAKLSSDIEQLVAANPDGVIIVEGANGKHYYVMTEQALQVRQYVLRGLKQADDGLVSPWNTEEIIEKAQIEE